MILEKPKIPTNARRISFDGAQVSSAQGMKEKK